MTIKELFLEEKRKRPNFKITQTVRETGVLEAAGIFLSHSQILYLPLTGHFILFSTFLFSVVYKLLSKCKREEKLTCLIIHYIRLTT